MPTDFSQIIFNQQYHSYSYRGKALTSVTKKCYSVKPPFDRDRIAKKVAAERGVTVEAILSEWDAAGAASRDKGTRVHEWIANWLTGKITSDPLLDILNEKLPEMAAFENLWGRLQTTATVEKVEWTVGDAELGLGGTLDALLRGGDGVMIFDWKTGKNFTTENHFQKLLPPFADLDDCDLNAYSLQISTYRLILERNTDYRIGNCYIAHLGADGHSQVYQALDLRERVEKWLMT